MISIIAAIDQNNGIGKNGLLPWHLVGDMNHFKSITMSVNPKEKKQNVVIMGRKTWESLPPKVRPLPNRLNIVLTRGQIQNSKEIVIASGLDQALKIISASPWVKKVDQVFVIGGASVYELALEHPKCQALYLTRIHQIFECDTFFPKFKNKFQKIESSEVYEENNISYHFEKWIYKE